MNFAIFVTVMMIFVPGGAGAQNNSPPTAVQNEDQKSGTAETHKNLLDPRTQLNLHGRRSIRPPPAKAAGAPQETVATPEVNPAVTPGLWSCSCSNMKGKVCYEHEKISSMATAIRLAVRRCGDSCLPQCYRSGDVKTPVVPQK